MANSIVKKINCVSSEDPNCPATNLLDTDPKKKWKCAKPGENSAFVVLKLVKPIIITGFDIGNERSAFIEVLVAKSWMASQDFKEILLASCFMSPRDSRNDESPNQVRFFETKALCQDTANEKWDLVKIVCTQPHNTRLQYGLSFIKIRTTEKIVQDKSSSMAQKTESTIIEKQEPVSTLSQESRKIQLGRFMLREDSPDSDSLEASENLFSRWKQTKSSDDIPTQSTASQIRAASSTPNTHVKPIKRPDLTPKPKKGVDLFGEDEELVKKIDRNRQSLLYIDEDEVPNEKMEKKLADEKARKDKERAKEKHTEKEKPKKLDTSGSKQSSKPKEREKEKKTPKSERYSSLFDEEPTTSKKRLQLTPPEKPKDSPKKPKLEERKRNVTYKPFNRLLEKVVIVISGIQNPERGSIRDKALALGAKYKSDWDSSCTHLICAFKNTPKYRQVHGKGIIINKDWVQRCYAVKKKLSWRKFALDSDECEKSASEDEIYDTSLKPTSPSTSTITSNETHDDKQKKVDSNGSKITEKSFDETLAHYDLDDFETKPPSKVGNSESDDTDDEIERVRQKQQNVQEKAQKEEYEQKTEDENENTEEDKNVTQPIAEYFHGKTFYLCNDLAAVDVIKLERFIKEYKGEFAEELEQANYAISRTGANVSENFKGEVVRPLWIYECRDMECLIPTLRYKI